MVKFITHDFAHQSRGFNFYFVLKFVLDGIPSLIMLQEENSGLTHTKTSSSSCISISVNKGYRGLLVFALTLCALCIP